MNLKEIRAEIVKDNDDAVNNADLTGWINRALDDLSLIARYTRSITVTPVNNQFTLPSDFLNIVALSCDLPRLPLNDFKKEGYKLIGNIVKIQSQKQYSGPYELIYTATLPHLVGDTDVPEIPENFHDLLVTYTLLKTKYIDELNDMYRISNNEYNRRKSDLAIYINKKYSVQTPTKNIYSNHGTFYHG